MNEFIKPTYFRILEEQAEALLNVYSVAQGQKQMVPTPIEMIAEKLLNLTIEIQDLSGLGKGTIGVLIPSEKKILVDESCTENQYFFTIAHEIGHLLLHVSKNQERKFVDDENTVLKPNLSRSKSGKNDGVIESEANKLGAAILIPRDELKREVAGYGFIDGFAINNLSKKFKTSLETMNYRIDYLVKNKEDLGVPILHKSVQPITKLLD